MWHCIAVGKQDNQIYVVLSHTDLLSVALNDSSISQSIADIHGNALAGPRIGEGRVGVVVGDINAAINKLRCTWMFQLVY